MIRRYWRQDIVGARRKPSSLGALAKLAAALNISLDDLPAWLEPQQK